MRFIVELECDGKNHKLVNVNADVTLLFDSLQIGRVARCLDFYVHFPNAEPKAILTGNVDLVWSVNDQERGIGQAQPERSFSQVKQSAFARLEILFSGVLLEEGDSLGLTSDTFHNFIFDIGLAITVTRRAVFDGGFKFVDHMEVNNVGYD